MKWLTLFLCLLAMPTFAEDEIQSQDSASQIVPLPFVMQCSPVKPDQALKEQYGEIGFVEGNASVFVPSGQLINGKIRMFLNPEEPRTFTLMFEISPEVHCMLTSGQNLAPILQSKGI